MTTKFFSGDNLIRGFKVLGASIVTSIFTFIPAYLVMWLIKNNLFVIGGILGFGLVFFYYNTLGYWLKRLFGFR